MTKFSFQGPSIFKDKQNKKWFIKYNIKYPGEAMQYRKEYGKSYHTKLNYIKDLDEREVEANILLALVLEDLNNQIDPENKEAEQEAALIQQIKEAEQYHYDYCLNLFLKEKGYLSPKPKQENSAKIYKSFLKNNFKPMLVELGIVENVRKITKEHIQNLIDLHYFSEDNDDISIWGGVTCNLSLSYIRSFLEVLVDKKILAENPAKDIKQKPKGIRVEARKTIFTRAELDFLFNAASETDIALEAVYKLIYYGYIRISELFRLQLKDIIFEKSIINIPSEKAKSQKDGFSRNIHMYPKLKECLQRYINAEFGDDMQPDYYLFYSKKYNDKLHRKTQIQFYADSSAFFQKMTAMKGAEKLFLNRSGLYPYTLKHTGATFFIEDNINNSSPTKLLLHVQKQMRHKTLTTTQIYISRDLGLNLELENEFVFN